MIHTVICASKDEKDAAVKLYKDQQLSVTWYGPDIFVQAEKFAAGALADCTDCAAGGDAVFLVVACAAGKTPTPG